MKNFRLLSLFICLAFISSGCYSRPVVEKPKPTKPVVAVSIVPQESWVKAIAGDLVDVVTMIPPGKSPETYSPTPQQMIQFSKASLYFTMQVPAEAASILPKAQELNQKVRIIDLASAVREKYPDLKMEESDHEEDHAAVKGHSHGPDDRDPHIWLSPKRALLMVEKTANELIAFDPQNKAVYEKNSQDYIKQLRQLDQRIQSLLAGSKNKTFIIYHPSLGYFADEYGLTMLALEEHGKEATPQELQKAIDSAKKEKIKTILYQEEMDSRQAKAFAAEIGGVTLKITPLAADYIGAMDKLATTLAEGTR